jgi:hypothetical protein
MAHQPILCAENYLNPLQFPGHTISAEEEATGYEVWHVGNGRRSSRDYWTPTTANSLTWIRVVFDTPRDINFVALDRGHNLAGYGVQVWATDDATDFSGTYSTPVNATIPSTSASADIDATNGVLTAEGVWMKRFTTVSAQDAVQLYIPAMGAGLTPQVVGLWLGTCFAPTRPFDVPYDDDGVEAISITVESDAGWRGYGPTTLRRGGSLNLRLVSAAEYETARYHLIDHFAAGSPMWIVFDESAAHRSVLAGAAGRIAFPYTKDWWQLRRVSFDWREWEPAP